MSSGLASTAARIQEGSPPIGASQTSVVPATNASPMLSEIRQCLWATCLRLTGATRHPCHRNRYILPASPHDAGSVFLRIAAHPNISRINAGAAASHGAPVVHALHQLRHCFCQTVSARRFEVGSGEVGAVSAGVAGAGVVVGCGRGGEQRDRRRSWGDAGDPAGVATAVRRRRTGRVGQDTRRPGRKPSIPEETVAEIVRLTTTTTQADATYRSCRTMAKRVGVVRLRCNGYASSSTWSACI
ncbi:hypothetical protein ACVWWN_003991 [Mycobacterium sp. URHB0021]